MTTGELIKELRIKKGMTQEELAAKTDISVRTIQRIEHGEVDPRAYTLQTIAAALDIEFELLNNTVEKDFDLEREKESKLWLPILHLSGLFLLLIPSVLIWFWKKDKIKNMREHGINVINFQISMLIILVPCGIFAFLIFTIPIIIFIGVFSTIVIIINTVKVINNQDYKYPMTFKILKP